MRSSDSNQKIQELMKDFFLVSSVSVLAIVCSFPLWFTFVVSSHARSVVSWRCQNFCGSDLRVKEFVAVALCYVLCVRLRLWTEGFIESRSLWYWKTSIFPTKRRA